jgi:hypothetical protein
MKTIAFVALTLLAVGDIRADWKTWLHGTGAAATPGPPDATAATVSFAPEIGPDKQVQDFLLAFAEAMRVHNGAELKPRISGKFTVPEMPAEHNAIDFFMQAMVKIKAPNEMIVTAIEPEGDGRSVKVDFRSDNRPLKTRTFRFDADGKLLSADFFSLQRQHGLF